MRKFLMGALAAAAFILSPFSMQASAQAAEKYEFEKPHTQILFFVNHLGFSHSSGRFHDFDGHFCSTVKTLRRPPLR
ncbi:MAG: hypothetical protein ACK4VI_03505 [Alphaproteobacteria bacterium]